MFKKMILLFIAVILFVAGLSIYCSTKADAASTASGIFPGMIIGYDSDSNLSYYYFCDGTDGTPDLRDKMIVGAGDTYALGNTGGATSHSHTYTGSGGAYMDSAIIIKSGTGVRYASSLNLSADAGNTDSKSSIPPYNALKFWQVGSGTQGVPNSGIVWWDDTEVNIPDGWSVFTALVNKFAIGAGSTYSRNDIGGATSHYHTTTGNLTGSYLLIAGTALAKVVSGGDYARLGAWDYGDPIDFDAYDLTPMYYGLIPIKNTSGGTRGIISGMVVPYNDDINDLPAGWSEFTGARNRFVVGAGDTYDLDESSGWSTHNHVKTALAVGSGLVAGTNIPDEYPDGIWNASWSGTINLGTNSVDNLPSYHALYWVKKD